MRHVPASDVALARRIEGANAVDLSDWVQDSRVHGTYPEAASLRVGGGAAVWFSPGNVVNGSSGLGMQRPVEPEEVAALVAFFAERDEPARVDVCPYAHPSLMRWLAESGFLLAGFETVLFQPLPVPGPPPPSPGVTVRVAESAEDRAVWADLEARGFTDDCATDEHLALAGSIAVREDVLPFIGYLNGSPAGTGLLYMHDGLAMFNGDSTLPSARNRGVQSAILGERLRYASAAGCDMAGIEAAPGGVSQRNQLRAGFRVAYTRVTMERPLQARADGAAR